MQEKMEEALDDFRDAYSPEEYRLKMREAERRFMESTLLDREVLTAENINKNSATKNGGVK